MRLSISDHEPDREDGLCSIRKMLKEAKGIGDFLGEMRDRTFKKYDAFSVGEVFDEKDEEIPDFIGDNGYFSSMFDFEETIWGASGNRLLRMPTRNVALQHREKLAISDLFPILLKIMTSLVVSADISRKVTAVTQVRRCLAV